VHMTDEAIASNKMFLFCSCKVLTGDWISCYCVNSSTAQVLKKRVIESSILDV